MTIEAIEQLAKNCLEAENASVNATAQLFGIDTEVTVYNEEEWAIVRKSLRAQRLIACLTIAYGGGIKQGMALALIPSTN